MRVTPDQIERVCRELEERPVISLDTETTGLRPWHGDRPFSLIMDEFYFHLADFGNEQLESVRRVLAGERIWVGHNLKFDILMCELAGLGRIRGKLHCTQTTERLLDDRSMGGQLSLQNVAPRYGARKSDEVERYIQEHKLYTMVDVPGKKQREKRLHYDQVPQDIITRYGLGDTAAAMEIAKGQRAKIRALDGMAQPHWPKLWDLYENECKLLDVVYDMEREGVLVDRDFCHAAIAHERETIASCEDEFKHLTGHVFKKSGKLFSQIFADEKEKFVYTDKGNPKFDKEHIERFDHPAARLVSLHSQAKANINYYLGFLYHSDDNGRIHSSMGQHVARTGRFSSSAPNLQNLKSRGLDLSQPFVVRRAIVPGPGNYFCMIDYDQIEYRMMADYAGALELIRLVIEEGLDVHSATAEIATVTRREAKDVNFGIVYGQGDESLGLKLGKTKEEARAIRHKILFAAPEIEQFIDRVKETAQERGFIFNWMGRRNHYARDDYYKAPNGLIQGGAADVIKCAMIKVTDILKDFKTKLVLCIHDELVFEGPVEEMQTVPPLLKQAMESVFPFKHLPLTAGIDVSLKSLADKEAWA